MWSLHFTWRLRPLRVIAWGTLSSPPWLRVGRREQIEGASPAQPSGECRCTPHLTRVRPPYEGARSHMEASRFRNAPLARRACMPTRTPARTPSPWPCGRRTRHRAASLALSHTTHRFHAANPRVIGHGPRITRRTRCRACLPARRPWLALARWFGPVGYTRNRRRGGLTPVDSTRPGRRIGS